MSREKERERERERERNCLMSHNGAENQNVSNFTLVKSGNFCPSFLRIRKNKRETWYVASNLLFLFLHKCHLLTFDTEHSLEFLKANYADGRFNGRYLKHKNVMFNFICTSEKEFFNIKFLAGDKTDIFILKFVLQ